MHDTCAMGLFVADAIACVFLAVEAAIAYEFSTTLVRSSVIIWRLGFPTERCIVFGPKLLQSPVMVTPGDVLDVSDVGQNPGTRAESQYSQPYIHQLLFSA